ncbi:hypothetical protein [Pseudoalteromonas phage J2-1_QLiu-2017]|nr:hypothetical protein [Pseudoalteromonas phage J2-1_QLiu-2017]
MKEKLYAVEVTLDDGRVYYANPFRGTISNRNLVPFVVLSSAPRVKRKDRSEEEWKFLVKRRNRSTSLRNARKLRNYLSDCKKALEKRHPSIVEFRLVRLGTKACPRGNFLKPNRKDFRYYLDNCVNKDIYLNGKFSGCHLISERKPLESFFKERAKKNIDIKDSKL